MIFFSMLLTLNLTILIATVAALLIHRSRFANSSKQLLVRLAFTTAIVAPIAIAMANSYFEPKNIFEPPVQIAASAPKIESTVMTKSATNSAKIAATTETFGLLTLAFMTLTAGAALFRLVILIRDRRRLANLCADAITLRQIGTIKIQLSRETQTPFAARYARRALIVIPEILVGTDAMTVAIHHELQHHRQRDLQWSALLEVSRLIAGWNPLVLRALERIEEIDELACDENLLGRGQIEVKRYANGLFEAALAITNNREAAFKLAGTARMATSPNFLKRRIEMTLTRKLNSPNRKIAMTLATLAIVITTAATAWAGQGLIKDRRISQSQAEAYAKRINSDIPIVINKRVLKYLNLATGTPRTRFYMRNALKRMKTYQPMIEAKLKSANLSRDLLAVPAMESGFQNTETPTSAGIWQFIPETARRYGLQVDDTHDERLDAARETDAAVAYLSHLQSLFQNDWMLSLLSYNAGESTVQELIAKTGERDIFKLADEGKIASEENANYVAKFIVALIVINNPGLVNE
jgi:membrane-bound lytic murein transglycosylase D